MHHRRPVRAADELLRRLPRPLQQLFESADQRHGPQYVRARRALPRRQRARRRRRCAARAGVRCFASGNGNRPRHLARRLGPRSRAGGRTRRAHRDGGPAPQRLHSQAQGIGPTNRFLAAYQPWDRRCASSRAPARACVHAQRAGLGFPARAMHRVHRRDAARALARHGSFRDGLSTRHRLRPCGEDACVGSGDHRHPRG